MAADRYDVIITGTGAGGGTLAYHLARAGKRILILERGLFLPQEKPSWNTNAVFLNNRYHTKDVWTDHNDAGPVVGRTTFRKPLRCRLRRAGTSFYFVLRLISRRR